MAENPTRAASKLTPPPTNIPYLNNGYGNYVLGAEGGVTLPADFVPANDRSKTAGSALSRVQPKPIA